MRSPHSILSTGLSLLAGAACLNGSQAFARSDLGEMHRNGVVSGEPQVLLWSAGLLAVSIPALLVWIVSLRRRLRSQTQKLRETTDLLGYFKGIVDTTKDHVGMASLDRKALYVNPAGRVMLGIGADEDVSGLAFEEVYTKQALEELEYRGFPHLMVHGHWKGELDMMHRDGHVFPTSTEGFMLRTSEGQPARLSSIARDITEQKKADKLLREANEKLARFYLAAESSTELIAMSNLEKVPLYMNPAGRAMLGIGLDEDVSETDPTSIYTPETNATFEREAFACAFEHGHWHGEVTMLHRDGHSFPVSFTGFVLRDADGKPTCMSCVAHDITQRIAMEKQLRDSLEQERELNQLKSSFVNTISHEFRTPLGIILFASSMLQRAGMELTDEERAEQFQAIDEAVVRMNDLVEQSLSLGRAETTGPKLENIDLLVLLRRLVDEMLSSTSHRSPVTLEVDEGLPGAVSDPTMLRAIVGNLISNALKYSPAGTPVTVGVRQEGPRAVITVRDHGPGLREEDMPKLFTMFYRGGNIAGIPGSGLGLAIVKRCTESLGGTVIARNAQGGDGAEFIVEVPLFSTPDPT